MGKRKLDFYEFQDKYCEELWALYWETGAAAEFFDDDLFEEGQYEDYLNNRGHWKDYGKKKG